MAGAAELKPERNVLDVQTLSKALQGIAHRWHHLGLLLGLSTADLECISLSEQLPQSQSHSQLNVHMGRVIAAWLKEEAEDQVKKHQLVQALQSMREQRLALKLENELLLPIERDILFKILSPISHRWQEFAIFLGLPLDLLESIQHGYESKEGGERRTPLEERLVSWLKRSPKPQLEDVIHALRSLVMSAARLGKEIQRLHTTEV